VKVANGEVTTLEAGLAALEAAARARSGELLPKVPPRVWDGAPTAPEFTQGATAVIELGYLGSGFAGFAEQPGLRTVAGELRQALETYLRRPVELACAGRTDSGVHALAQFVSVPLTAEEVAREGVEARRLYRALCALMPPDAPPRAIWKAAPGFNCRFDALARTYVYRLVDGAQPVLLQGRAWWQAQRLDVEAMREAAAPWVGEHDFKSFCKALSAQDKPTKRCVLATHVWRAQELGEQDVLFGVVGTAFLHSMVRTMAGTLVEVGRGRKPVSWAGEALAACDRAAAGPTAPAEGLTFTGVWWPHGALQPWYDVRTHVSM
jgi:tRNA pseudouridine38-40 synthase